MFSGWYHYREGGRGGGEQHIVCIGCEQSSVLTTLMLGAPRTYEAASRPGGPVASLDHLKVYVTVK